MVKVILMYMAFCGGAFFILSLMAKNYSTHPIFLTIMIIAYNLLLVLNMSMWKMNFMFSLMMILIMISGLLIMFLYFTSLISNAQMIFKMGPKTLLTLSLGLFSPLTALLYNKSYITSSISPTKENSLMTKINEKSFMNISNIYLWPFGSITMVCMMFLLIVLFISIKLTSLKSGPLRKP